MEKGGKIWLDTMEKKRTFVQCLNCGYIHIVEKMIPMEISVMKVCCPNCDGKRAINCGYDDLDVLELKDYFLDKRYYY